MASRQPFPPHPKPKPAFLFLIITIFASLIIFFAIISFLYYLWYSLIHRSRTSPCDTSSPPLLPKLRRFSFRELISATNNFSDDNSIGKGGSGTVFRGILRNGKLVAIKLLDSASFQAEREFQNELQILGGLKSPFLVSLIGYCVEKKKRLVVYEYMPNRSLQESLFSESNPNNIMSWERRFEIILDVSRALSFLHLGCNPPVIHGDVKPSNVLLDCEYRAKLSDFGLSRLKLNEPEFGIDLFSQDLGKSQDLSGNLLGGAASSPAIGTPADSANEVDFALALQASSSSPRSLLNLSSLTQNNNGGGHLVNGNVKGKEVFVNIENNGEDNFANYDDEPCSFDHSRELSNLQNVSFIGDDSSSSSKVVGKKQWGKDWWWKQDGSGELCSKDYVREWIGSQICSSANPDCDDDKKSPPRRKPDHGSPLFEENDDRIRSQEPRNKKHRKMQEWWREEHLDELSKKGTTTTITTSSTKPKTNNLEKNKCKKGFRLDLGRRLNFRNRRRKRRRQTNDDEGDPNMEFSFRRSSKRRNESEMWSGELLSRELSSTTSMRGTLCYVAPEGYLMEKSDIYSLGVLILVIVSGRRPLHVLASPMKLEKANLISWCRQLAQGGDLLELVDERLKVDHYNKEQAGLCINLALACLQKMPELRPDIGDVVKILKGEMDLPPLPFEFSPSPPSKPVNRSRRKHRTSASSVACTTY